MILLCLYSLCGMDKGFSFHASFTASYTDFTASAPALTTEGRTTVDSWPVGDVSQTHAFHHTAEHQEQNYVALKERNSGEERPCIWGHMLKILQKHPGFIQDMHCLAQARVVTARVASTGTLRFWRKRMFVLKKGSQFLHKHKRTNSVVVD